MMYNDKKQGLKSPIVIVVLLVVVLISHTSVSIAQVKDKIYRLKLEEVVQFAKSQNKWIKAAEIEETAVREERKDAYIAMLPTVNVNGSYQRFSNLTLFTEGLSHSSSSARKPTSNSAAFGIDALFNIYNGGKLDGLQKEQNARLNLAQLNAKEESGNIALQAANHYLDLMLLNEVKKFTLDQLKRAQTRLSNINSLYKNQKVTKSDVLRAEVTLANVELSLQQNENNLMITNQRLDVLINVPDSVKILPIDSVGMIKPEIGSILLMVKAGGVSSYSLQKASEHIELEKARLKSIESNNKPSLGLYMAYGLNYPNYLFFPPVNQVYAIGFVGLKAQYSISSLYHNKHKVNAVKLRVKELEIEQEAYDDHVKTLIKANYIKYVEALRRVSVNEHSVEQAAVNYKIVNTKYLNQLSLLTDLLDADNLYQESRLNFVKAQIDALGIYYQMLYINGNL